MPSGPLFMGPPLSPRETRRSGRRSAPSVSASASKSPDSDQPTTKERPNTSRASANHRNKRLKQEDYDEIADDRKNNSVSSASSGFNIANGKGKRKSKDKQEKQSTSGVNEDPEVVVEDPPQDPIEDEEEQGITRCVCGSSGAFSLCVSFPSDCVIEKRTTQMPENSWCNAKHARSGNMDSAWVISQRNRYMTTTTTAKFADPNYIPSCSSKFITDYPVL